MYSFNTREVTFRAKFGEWLTAITNIVFEDFTASINWATFRFRDEKSLKLNFVYFFYSGQTSSLTEQLKFLFIFEARGASTRYFNLLKVFVAKNIACFSYTEDWL